MMNWHYFCKSNAIYKLSSMKKILQIIALVILPAAAFTQDRPTPTGTGPEVKPSFNVTDKKSSNQPEVQSEQKSPNEQPPSQQIDNKIAVSDPGAPADKANDKKKAPASPAEKKVNPEKGISPK